MYNVHKRKNKYLLPYNISIWFGRTVDLKMRVWHCQAVSNDFSSIANKVELNGFERVTG